MLPLSLYIHIPWCIRKCPYCDFNSHHSPDELPEQTYIRALLNDLDQDLLRYSPRTIHSIFIGGGTPSLFNASSYEFLFDELQKRLTFKTNLEITLEANPGTLDETRFKDYRAIGINRLSLGIQSFNDIHLKKLGRVHDSHRAKQAIEIARKSGFDNINLDLMHGLPNQTLQQGLEDLTTAITFAPEHISWYQLTIEPNTVFYKTKPILPSEDECAAIEEEGFILLNQANYSRYEISAFCRSQKMSEHNLNYWLFGDYYGIGAGAHGKWTDADYQIHRTQKHRMPTEYIKSHAATEEIISENDVLLEFMLNATRLEQEIQFALFESRTGLRIDKILPLLRQAAQKGLVQLTNSAWKITPLGRKFTNDLQAIFLT